MFVPGSPRALPLARRPRGATLWPVTTWRFDDGSVLRSGGRVTGKGPAAAALRSRIADQRPALSSAPSTPVTLAVDSIYLLDCLAVEVRFATMTKFATAYERDEDDAPPELRPRLRAARLARDLDSLRDRALASR